MTTLSLDIDYKNEDAGWIACSLGIDGKRHDLSATKVFPPFLRLLHFIKAIAGGKLPHAFFWDEEGLGVDFEATPAAEDDARIHLKIASSTVQAPWFDAEIEKETVIQAFLLPLIDLADNFPQTEGWDMPRFAVENVKRAIADRTLLRSDTQLPRRLEFCIYGGYEEKSAEYQVRIDIWLEDRFIHFFDWNETSPFWTQWLDFLGRISSGDLPAQLELQEKLSGGVLALFLPSTDLGLIRTTYLQAEPLEGSQDFLLKIQTTNWEGEGRFSILEEVVERRQCVRQFADVFGRFLREEYQSYQDLNNNAFDLRTLPFEKLA